MSVFRVENNEVSFYVFEKEDRDTFHIGNDEYWCIFDEKWYADSSEKRDLYVCINGVSWDRILKFCGIEGSIDYAYPQGFDSERKRNDEINLKLGSPLWDYRKQSGGYGIPLYRSDIRDSFYLIIRCLISHGCFAEYKVESEYGIKKVEKDGV